ncbi:mCG141470, isoform CRA_d [Mus musculus]|nr:mCG141470, isoform CRA_d [Mus musculus]
MNVGTTRPAERLHGYASHRTFSAQPGQGPWSCFAEQDEDINLIPILSLELGLRLLHWVPSLRFGCPERDSQQVVQETHLRRL